MHINTNNFFLTFMHLAFITSLTIHIPYFTIDIFQNILFLKLMNLSSVNIPNWWINNCILSY